MQKNIILAFILFVLTISQQSNQNYSTQQDVIILDNTNLQKSIYESEDPWLLDLYAPWCGHCIKMSPEWDKLATKLKGVVKVAKIDASQYPQFDQLYGLKGFPHIVFIPQGPKDKSLYYRHTGPRTADAFQKWTLSKIKQHKRSFLYRLTDQEKWKQTCLGQHSDFCTIFFLPNIQNSTQEQQDFLLKIINGVIKKFNNQPLSWLWTQIGDHQGLEYQFSLRSQVPGVVLVNQSGRRFSVMPKSFTEDDFTQWLKNVFDIQFKDFDNELIFGNDEQKLKALKIILQNQKNIDL